MEIKRLGCPTCGAKLDVDTSQKVGICKYCNSAYTFDDGTIRIEHSFTNQDDQRLEANANVTLYKYKNYDKSLYMYLELYNKYQDNQDYLLGIILSLTEEFSLEEYAYSKWDLVIHYWELFLKIGNKDTIERYQSKID